MENNMTLIPAQLAQGFIGTRDFRILALEGDSVLMESESEISPGCLNSPFNLKLFDFKRFAFDDFAFPHWNIVDEIDKGFYFEYKLEIQSGDSENYYRALDEMRRVSDFRRDISDLDEMEERKKELDFLNGHQNLYPRKEDEHFFDSYKEQVEEWYRFDLPEEQNKEFAALARRIRTALAIDNTAMYGEAVASGFPRLIETCLQQPDVRSHGIFSRDFTRLYIGNAFCPHLSPRATGMLKLLDRALEANLEVTVVFSYMTEDMVGPAKQMLKLINKWCVKNGRGLEIEVNDLGMLDMFNENNSNLTPILGRMLNKRTKDPTHHWKWGYRDLAEQMKENHLNARHFIDYLAEHGINRFEFESCGGDVSVPPGKHSLHFPFYQMNTSQYCVLYADCNYFHRKFERPVKQCPRYCRHFVSLYPKHLDMIGRGNSNFGFDNRIFLEPDLLRTYIDAGIDRLVYSI